MPDTNIVRLIREQCNIVEVIGAYVQLLPAGKNYKALCPFHREKTPSFFANPEKGFWHCFGCGAGGDVLDFMQRIEGLTFTEAVAKLARQLRIQWQPSPSLRREEWQRERLLRLNKWAMEFFERVLWTSESGEKARQFLFQRQISQVIARQFRLGYAPPNWDTLARSLREEGISLDEALQVGLIQKAIKGDGYFDRFRDRLVFPIFNLQGEVIGFGGRTLGDSDVKYLNTPETPLFQKRKCFYALHLARSAIREKGEVIVVEGYTDAITLHQAGFTNAVATMGTALNADTVQILRRYTNRIILAYDADSAGLNAVLRTSDLFREYDIQVRVAVLPEGTDPDSLIRERGAMAFQACLERVEPLVEFRVRQLLRRYPDATAEGLRAVVSVLASIRDPIEQKECLQKLAEEWSGKRPEQMESLENALIRALLQYWRQQKTATSASQHILLPQDPIAMALTSTSVIPVGIQQAERELMATLIQDKEAARRILALIHPDEFLLEKHRELARLVAACLEDDSFSDLTLLVAEIGDEELRQVLSGLLLYDLSFLHAKNALEERVARLRRYHLEQEMKQRRTELLRKSLTGQLSRDDPSWKMWEETLRALKT